MTDAGWATDTNYSGLTGAQAQWNGTPTKVAPTSGERATGVAPRDPIAAQKLNYILGEAYMRKARVTYAPSGQVDNVNPTDFATAGVLMLTPSAATVITGLVPGTYTDRELWIVHSGTAGAYEYPVIIPEEHPDSTAANRVRGRLGPLPLLLLPGDAVKLLYNATASRWDCVHHSRGMTPSGFCSFWSDFGPGSIPFTEESGSITYGASTGVSSTEKCVGVADMSTQGSSTISASKTVLGSQGSVALAPAQGQAFACARVMISAASDGTNTFRVAFGFHDCDDQADGVCDNGVIIGYTHSENSGKWMATAAGSASRTEVDTTVTPSTSVFHTMFLYCSAAWDYALAAISTDGIDWTFATLTGANLPTASELIANVGLYLAKSAGATARHLYVDFLGARFDGNRG